MEESHRQREIEKEVVTLKDMKTGNQEEVALNLCFTGSIKEEIIDKFEEENSDLDDEELKKLKVIFLFVVIVFSFTFFNFIPSLVCAVIMMCI